MKIPNRTLAAALVAGLITSVTYAAAQDRPYAGTKLTYWGSATFSQEARDLLTNEITEWGRANGVETEVVLISNNETVQKVSAAVEAGTMPDALDLNLDLLLLLSRQGVFADVGELYDELAAEQGGWFASVGATADVVANQVGGRTGIPFGVTGNLLLRRADLLEAEGFTVAPATWDELAAQAAAVTAPPVYGLGLALSNVGDGNVQIAVLQSFGGRIASDDGQTVTIKSDATRNYLNWVVRAWESGAFPPGVLTWDGAGDNQAYLSGSAAFMANPGSVALAAKTDDPELYEATHYSPLPSGPIATVNPLIMYFRAVSAKSANPEAAKALIKHLTSPEFLDAYYQASIYGPVLNAQRSFVAFDGSDPIKAGMLQLVESGTPPAYPDVYNAGYAAMYTSFIVPKMVQRVLVDGWDVDRAMDEAQEQTQSLYGRN